MRGFSEAGQLLTCDFKTRINGLLFAVLCVASVCHHYFCYIGILSDEKFSKVVWVKTGTDHDSTEKQ